MKHPFRLLFILPFLTAGLCSSNGAVTINAIEINGDVIFSGSGTLNLTALTYLETTNLGGGFNSLSSAGAPVILLGTFPGTAGDKYQGTISAPAQIGNTFGFMLADEGAGDKFGANSALGEPAIVVPESYVSESALAGSITYFGATLTSLDLIPGQYSWTWGSGQNADSLTLNIVPEPARTLLCILSICGIVLRRHRPHLLRSSSIRGTDS